MSALTQDRNTPAKDGKLLQLPVAAATTIYGGSLAARNAAGDVVPGSTAIGLTALGRAEERVDNSAGIAGAKTVRIATGVFQFANSASADAITKADIGNVCYIVDDQTVARTDDGASRSAAGLVIEVDAQGVWVDVGNLGAGKALGVPVITIGAEASNAIAVSIQLKDPTGADLTERAAVTAYLSDDANGDSIAGTAPDGNVAIGTDGLLIPLVANKAFTLVSEADGDIDLSIGESSTDTWYLIIVMPDGRLVASDAITFA